MVECDGVSKTYLVHERTGLFRRGRRREVEALRGVGFRIEGGEFVGFLGRNGAGKTTLLKILSTLLLPTEGAVRVAGYDVVREPRQVRRRIGLVLSGERTLYWKLTGRENLLLFAGLYDVPRRLARARAEELLELTGLSGFTDVPVEKYSTGMKKRLALAKALIHEPQVLVLDEPTAGLDPHGVEEVWRVLVSLREKRVTVLTATHNMLEAETVPTRLLVIEEGRLIADGTPAEIKAGAGAGRSVAVVARGDPARAGLAGLGARVQPLSEGKFLAVARAELLPQLVTALHGNGLALESVEVKESSLWDAFLTLTGRLFDDGVTKSEEEDAE